MIFIENCKMEYIIQIKLSLVMEKTTLYACLPSYVFDHLQPLPRPASPHYVSVLSDYCHNPNDNTTQPTIQPQHCSWVGHEIVFAHHPSQKLNCSLHDHQVNIY